MGRPIQESRPPSRYSRFTVGRDSHGWWVVCDQKGLVGGLFTDKASAIHFAMAESDCEPGAVCCVPDDTILNPDPIFDPVRPTVRQQVSSQHL